MLPIVATQNLFAMMKYLFVLFLSLFVFSSATTAQVDSTSVGLVASFPLDGSATELTGHTSKATLTHAEPADDRGGARGKAVSFKFEKNVYGRLNTPINLNPKSYPEITVVFWIKFEQLASRLSVLDMGDKKKYRALYTINDDGNPIWGLGCGKEGEMEGPRITAEWTFVAVVYDQANKAARLVVNNQVYAAKAYCYESRNNVSFGGFSGCFDELKIYNRVLSLQELEKLYGSSIDVDADDYPIYVKEDFKKEKALAQRAELDSLRERVVVADELNIFDSETHKAKIDFLTSGDSLLITEMLDSYAVVRFKGDKLGSVSYDNLFDYTRSVHETGLARQVSMALQDLFDFTKLRSWIIVGLLLVLLVLAFRFFYQIDNFFMRMKKDKLSVASGGKADNSVVENKPSVLERVFPLSKFRKWPLYIGAIIATLVLGTLLWDKHEAEWFLNKGIGLLPGHYDATVHWVLYGGMWLVLLMVITLFLESFTIAGPLGGSLRVVYLLLVNFIMLVVTFYLFILVLIILAVMFGLFLLSSMGSGTKYRCTRCGRIFYGDHCPNCG